jgi:hypothetical protein
MRTILIVLIACAALRPLYAVGQGLPGSEPSIVWKISPDTATAGFRFDDNVYRSVVDSGRLADGIVSADWGGFARVDYDLFKAYLDYHVGDDQYLNYTNLNNLKNDINLLLAVEPTEWSFYYKFDYFIRNSQYYDFNYFDVNSVIGASLTPGDHWSYEAQYKNLARQYYDTDPSVWSRNFVDQSGVLSVQREVDDRLTVKLLGSYTNRQFNRYAVAQNGSNLSSLSVLQNDNTWKALLNAHFYFASILQDINVEEERTDSNSYGFSNSVQSASWAGVIRPVSGFYLELIFRLYIKTYDVSPLTNADLQLGYIDEDSQDLLAVKANWDLGSDWVGSLGVNRVRTESDQPNSYYIKDVISAQLRRSF